MSKKEYEVQGATIEVDGVVYFIPRRELKAYKVPKKMASDFRPWLAPAYKDRPRPIGGPIGPVRASFGYVPLDRQQYSGAFTSEDFITMSRVK